MAPPMSHPFKHPKTGIFWLRKRVPKDLVAVLGRAEVTRSLETRDPGEAKSRLVRALSDLEAQWANLRAGPRTLTEEEAHGMAAPVYDQWLDRHRKEPSLQTFWPVQVGSKVFAPPPPLDFVKVETSHSWDLDPDLIRVVQLETWCLQRADEGLAAHGLVVDEDSRRKFAKAIAAAVQRAS